MRKDPIVLGAVLAHDIKMVPVPKSFESKCKTRDNR